jgi:hypothetical protein
LICAARCRAADRADARPTALALLVVAKMLDLAAEIALHFADAERL